MEAKSDGLVPEQTPPPYGGWHGGDIVARPHRVLPSASPRADRSKRLSVDEGLIPKPRRHSDEGKPSDHNGQNIFEGSNPDQSRRYSTQSEVIPPIAEARDRRLSHQSDVSLPTLASSRRLSHQSDATLSLSRGSTEEKPGDSRRS